MVCHGRGGRRAGYTKLVALLAGIAAMLLAPEASAQQPNDGPLTVSSSIDPADVAVGERFSLVISASGLPTGDLSIEEPDYPDAITKLAGASIAESTGSGLRGRGQRQVEIQIPFRADRAGRVIIEPVVLRDQFGNTWQTQRHLLEIAISPGNSSVPFDAAWHVPQSPIYEGQTVPVYLDIERATSFSFPGEIDVDPPAGAVFEEVQGIGSVASEVVQGVELLRYPVATFLMTPSSAGELRIPSALVGSGEEARRAQARVLDILPLPEAVRGTLAVGDYRFSAELSENRLREGESATLTLRAQGTGNLDFFRFPEVNAENATIGSVGEQSEVAPVSQGLVGSRELRLRITPREPGTHEVVVEPFTWLEPESGRVQNQGPFRFSLELVAAETTVEETRESTPFGPLDYAAVERVQPVDMYRIPAFYLLFLPPFVTIVLALAGVGVKHGAAAAVLLVPLSALLMAAAPLDELPREEIERGVSALEAGRLTEAVWRLERLHEDYPRSPGILYNLGYASYLDGDRGGTVFALREAVRLRPGFEEARSGLRWVEEQYGLDRQVEITARVHPDTVLVVLFVLAYLMAGLVFALRRRGEARFAISFISSTLLMITALVLMVYAVRTAAIPTAVVSREEAALKQVPVAEAKDWLSLPAGTAVRPLEQYEHYRLVRTGFGVEGWITEDLLLVSRP